MMNKNTFLYKGLSLGFLLCLLIFSANAQNVTVDASIDSLQLFIGQQAKIKQAQLKSIKT